MHDFFVPSVFLVCVVFVCGQWTTEPQRWIFWVLLGTLDNGLTKPGHTLGNSYNLTSI